MKCKKKIKTLITSPGPRRKANEVLPEKRSPAEIELFHNSDQELCYSDDSLSPLQAEEEGVPVIIRIKQNGRSSFVCLQCQKI